MGLRLANAVEQGCAADWKYFPWSEEVGSVVYEQGRYQIEPILPQERDERFKTSCALPNRDDFAAGVGCEVIDGSLTKRRPARVRGGAWVVVRWWANPEHKGAAPGGGAAL